MRSRGNRRAFLLVALLVVAALAVFAARAWRYAPSDSRSDSPAVGSGAAGRGPGRTGAQTGAKAGANADAATPGDTGFRFEGTTLRVLKPGSGEVEWELTSKSVDVSQTTEVATLGEIVAKYLDDQGVLSEVRANGVKLEWDSRTMRFSGDVLVKARNGARLSTENLLWDGARDKYVVEDGVRFEDGTTILTGRRLLADAGLENAKVSGDVKVMGAGRQ